jgi:PAS domain S-box-containing protein
LPKTFRIAAIWLKVVKTHKVVTTPHIPVPGVGKQLPPWLKRRSGALSYGGAILLAVLAQASRLPLHPPTFIPHITYVPFILLAAAYGGFGPGLLSTVLCVLEAMYFAIEPLGSLRVGDPRHWLGIGATAITGVVASLLFQRLRRSEARQRAANLELATVQGFAPVMLLVVDDALRVRKANHLAVQFAGCNVSDVLGLGPGGAIGCLNALADPEGCGHGPACGECAIREAVSDTLRNGTPHRDVESWVPVCVGGLEQTVCLQVSTVPMQVNGNGKTALICAQDITERKQAETELRKQRDALQRQAELIDLSHDAIIVMDEHRLITGWNKGAQEIYGWPEAEALGNVTHEFLRTSSVISNATVDGILGQSGRWEGELEHSRRDGTRLTVDSRQVALRDPEGNPAGILEINRDITESKQVQAELREAHRRTTAILESISDGFNVFDREWRYIYVNPAAARMVHMSREELLGKKIWELWPSLPDTPFGAAYRRAVAENVQVRVEAFYPEPLNAWFEVRCYPSPEGLSIFFNDVTKRKQAEQEIQRLNTDLEQRVRDRTAQLEAANQELESFAYSVSHDLRAPLRGIDGWSMALVEDFSGQLDEEGRHYLGRVRSEAQRMGQLIDDLLRLSRVTRAPLERDSVDLTAVAQSIAGNLREIHADRRIEFTIQPGLTARGDARLLEVVLTNLLNNAAKFTGKLAEAQIGVGRTEHEGQPAFFVRDNGAGFDMAYARSLFGPFQRLHRASEFPGTGIGQATVQRIVHRHGGRVWAEAQVDRGATFYFTLG